MKIKKTKKKSLKNKSFGFGINKKNKITDFLGLNHRKKPRKFKIKQKNKIKKIISKSRKKILGKKLKIKINKIIEFYINMKSYKGMRHKFKYPIRGQRTRTNAKTIKKNN